MCAGSARWAGAIEPPAVTDLTPFFGPLDLAPVCWTRRVRVQAAFAVWLLTFSYSIGVSIPSELWRRLRLWKISRYSNSAALSSTRVFHLVRFKSSVWSRAQKDSITALSKASPTDPIDGTKPARRTRSLKAQEVNWVP